MTSDYLPHREAELDEWLQSFAKRLAQVGPQVGFDANLIADIQAAVDDWVQSYQSHLAKHDEARGARQTKDARRRATVALVRKAVRMLQAAPNLSDGQRQLLNITVKDRTLTPLSPDYIRAVKAPLIWLDFSVRGQITIHFGKNPKKERENAKPEGILGAKIWYRRTDSDTDGGWQWLADCTNSPYVHVVGSKTPMTFEYRVQWFDRKLRTGSFGDPVSATVTP